MSDFSNQTSIQLGYDLDLWNDYKIKKSIDIDISSQTNSHILICGMSGSGKSYFQTQVFAKLVQAQQDGEFYFADYKGDDSFSLFENSERYYMYKNTLDALNAVYERLTERLSNIDKTRHQITLIWDEYIANILSLISEDKKQASVVMNKVSEILLMGRSKSVRLIISCQRADAIAFPIGSRLNYGVIVILGAYIRSTYEMLMPDFINEINNRKFERGEGSVLIQGSELKFIKVPKITNENELNEVCKNALNSVFY